MRSRHPFAVQAAIPVALLLAVMSLGGLLVPATYALETPAWIDQAVGQDWFDLIVVVPWLAICGIAARGGSYRWGVLLAGSYAYTVYEGVIYAFAVHFNGFFLVYCATLGLAAFGLISQLGVLGQRGVSIPRRPARIAAAFLCGTGIVFALLWLADVVPASLRGRASPALVEVGLFTNPVHVLDLSFVLPAFLVTGVLLWRRQAAGFLYAPVLLAFGAVMAASIAGMMVAIRIGGGVAPSAVIGLMLALALGAIAAFVATARKLVGAES